MNAVSAEPNSLPHPDPAALVARVAELEAMLAEKSERDAALEAKLDALPMRLLEAAQATKPLMSVSDVARTLGVSKRTVETLVADEELRPLWIKGQRRFHPDAIDAYVRECARRSAA